MGRLKAWSGSPLVLLLALLGGAIAGYALPGLTPHYTLIGTTYLAVINMAALPLLVVATIFGLRQVAALPQSGWRLLRLLGMALGLMALCALVGLCAALLAQAGKDLSAKELQHLGQLVLSAGDGTANVEVALLDSGTGLDAAPPGPGFGLNLSNYFQSLAQGQLLSVLLGALLFGAGIIAQRSESQKALMGVFEGIYRTLETLISSANLIIPLLVFGMVALFASSVDVDTLLAMWSFLATFVSAALLLSGVAVWVVWRRSGTTIGAVMSALKTPALISLTSTSAIAAIPDTIHAMSSRLGYSRGVTEFVVPLVSIFVRCGSALYFSVLIVFVANMYGRPLGLTEDLLICVGAMLGGFASAGRAGAATLGFMGMALHFLQLPLEAVVPLFLAVEFLCEGPRNFLSFLLACSLVALVSDGLPTEKAETAESAHIESIEPIIFTFSKTDLAMLLVCVVLVMLFITSAGVGFGMR